MKTYNYSNVQNRAVISKKEWFITIVQTVIPIFGIIFVILHQHENNQNKRNFFCMTLYIKLLNIIFILVFSVSTMLYIQRNMTEQDATAEWYSDDEEFDQPLDKTKGMIIDKGDKIQIKIESEKESQIIDVKVGEESIDPKIEEKMIGKKTGDLIRFKVKSGGKSEEYVVKIIGKYK